MSIVSNSSSFLFFSDEFRRAVKVCTNLEMNPHVVHSVFQLFDTDGDGSLSHDEFVQVMKDRLHRGFKVLHSVMNLTTQSS